MNGRERYRIRLFFACIALFGVFLATDCVIYAQEDAVEPTVTHVARLNTSFGIVEIELYGKDAPKTVENFTGLIDQGFYDGILFHRVHPGFLIQAGDPQTTDSTLRPYWGSGGTSIFGSPFADELNPETPSFKRGYIRGTVAMANRGPNSNTSQFFIMLNEIPSLAKKYTMFGYVRNGMDIVDSIAGVELVEVAKSFGGRPKISVAILEASVETHREE